MKKILIIANGVVAKYFLERIITNLDNSNQYYVVYYEDEVLPTRKSENFSFFKFDPTSFGKLSKLLKMENFFEVMIILGNKTDTLETLKNIRIVRKNLPISIMDKWGLDIDDKNIHLVNTNDIIVNRFTYALPNVPVIAQNIGLGLGEIMEVSIPFTSSYVYRHISSINQVDWKIVALYRNNQLILARDSLMLQPNDILLTVGKPKVLKQVYRSIKREVGQFPAPFGHNLYLLIDMRIDTKESIQRAIESAIFLNSKLKNRKVIISVLHPNNLDNLDFIKSFHKDNITLNINYNLDPIDKVLSEDRNLLDIGMILVSNRAFKNSQIRESLYNISLPIFKIGQKRICKSENSIVILTDNKDLEKISSVMFDISSQMKLNISLLDLNPEGEFRDVIVEYFNSLSRIFSKNIDIVTEELNPIREARKIDNFLQFIPFTKTVAKSDFFSIFSNDVEKLYYKLDEYNQIFVPVNTNI